VRRAHHVTLFDHLDFSGFPLADEQHGRIWSGSTTSLGWIDPQTGATHVVDDVPGVYLAVYGDSLYRTAWAKDAVARYDISDDPRLVVRRQAPSPLNVAAGPEGVWASDHNHGNLLRLDPQTLRIVDKIPIDKVAIGPGNGFGPAGLVWQGENLWVNVKKAATLALVDRTGQVLRKIQLGGVDIGDDLALTSAGLWADVAHKDDSSEWTLVDTRTLRVKVRLGAPKGSDTWATPVEVNGQIWLPVDDKLVHLDPDRGWQPDRVVSLDRSDIHPRYATAGFGSVWISSLNPARIVRVDYSDLR
jgi:streptogramin lyase